MIGENIEYGDHIVLLMLLTLFVIYTLRPDFMLRWQTVEVSIILNYYRRFRLWHENNIIFSLECDERTKAHNLRGSKQPKNLLAFCLFFFSFIFNFNWNSFCVQFILAVAMPACQPFVVTGFFLHFMLESGMLVIIVHTYVHRNRFYVWKPVVGT